MTALPGKPAANATPANESGVEKWLASSPGARLQKGREAAKMDVSQAADALHLSPGVVKALEADDYRALPNATFVKGYIRSYARLLNIPAEDLVRSYESITGSAKPAATAPIEAPRTGPRFGGAVRFGVPALIALGVLWLVVTWSGAESPEPASSASVEAVVAEPMAVVAVQPESEAESSAAPAIDEPVGSTAVEAAPESSSEPVLEPEAQSEVQPEPVAPVEPEPVFTPEPEQSVEPAPEASAPAPIVPVPEVAAAAPSNPEPAASPADTGLLSMSFTGDCWVEVRDGTGELIYSNLRRHGQTLTLNGVPPFEAKLGNGNVVSVSYNGQPVSFRIPSHNVVRVRLGE